MSDKEVFNKESIQTIYTFLESNLQKEDVAKIKNELKHNFVLAKTKRKQQNKKSKKLLKWLSRKKKKQIGFYTIPRGSLKYEDIVSMNYLWTGYMEELLELDKLIPEVSSKNWESFTQSVYKADFHGSILKVIRSKCPSYVDKMGICIMDTKHTFKIISSNNVITTIPKKNSVFELHLKNLRITLFGKHMCIRPAERSTKKIKGHFYPDL